MCIMKREFLWVFFFFLSFFPCFVSHKYIISIYITADIQTIYSSHLLGTPAERDISKKVPC